MDVTVCVAQRRGEKPPTAAVRTFCVAWVDTGNRGTPLGGARLHPHVTSGTERDCVVPDICADVDAEDRARVLAVDADCILRDLPSGSRKILLLLQSEV